jgi:hypothetical protein
MKTASFLKKSWTDCGKEEAVPKKFDHSAALLL